MKLPVACPTCQTSRIRLLFQMPDGSTLHRCAQCGLVVRDRMMTAAESKARYSHPQYYSKQSSPEEGLYGYNNYMRDRHLLMWLFAERLDEIERLQPRGHLLDVGCGPGVMLDIARLRGWEAQGVDISTFAVETARKYYNLDILECDLLSAHLPGSHFDVVCMDDYIEHVVNPREILAEGARLLRPGGLLVLNTPSAGSLTAHLMRRNWFHYKQEEHFYFFTPKSARILLNDLGLDVLSIRRSPRFVDLKYLFTRFAYYSKSLSRVLLWTTERMLWARIGFYLYVGDMRILARKRADPVADPSSGTHRGLRDRNEGKP